MKSKMMLLLAIALASIVLFASGSGALRDLTASISFAGKSIRPDNSPSLFQSGLASLADSTGINGTVTDSVTTLPIEDANVTAGNVFDLTDSDGHYDLNVTAGNYTVSVTRSGYFSQSKNATVAANMTTTVNFALTPVPTPSAGTLEGNVTDASTHMPIADAIIMAGNKSAETNSSGRYKLELAPGTYNVTAKKSGYVSQTKTGIVITAGNVTTLNFELVRSEIKVKLVIHPRSLNLRSEGRWITATIEFEMGFNVHNVNVSSIRLNNTIPVDPAAPVEYVNSTLIVKFDREAVETLILSKLGDPSKFDMVTLTVTGKLNDGTMFTGSDTIKTIFNMPQVKKT